MDLVLRRPAKYSIFRNEEEIKLFILVTFAEIHETVKKKGGKLFFADETHIQQDSGNLRGFTIVGKAPKLIHNPKTSGHRVCSLLIVISREGDMTYTLETEKTSAVEFIDLLENVLKDNRNTMIHIILDNARIHHAKLVKEFLKKTQTNELILLTSICTRNKPCRIFKPDYQSRYKKSKING